MTTNNRGLVPGEERCKGTSRQSGKAEEKDVENAAKVVAYFRADVRRVYSRLGGTVTTPEDLLAGNLRVLLAEHSGEWKGPATELDKELEVRGASGLPRGCQQTPSGYTRTCAPSRPGWKD